MCPKQTSVPANCITHLTHLASVAEETGLSCQASLTCDLAPADSLWTVQRDGAVRLRMEGSGPSALPPLTVPQLFSEAVRRAGQKVALCERKAGEWHRMTYLEYEEQSRAVAKGLLKLGLERFQAVIILGMNSPQWFIAEMGSILAGTSSRVFLFVEVRGQDCGGSSGSASAVAGVKYKLPQLKAIVQWEGEIKDPGPVIYTWKELIIQGSEVPDSLLDDIIAFQKPNQCCVVIYNIANTGNARGVMLSHDNLTWVSRAACEMLGLGTDDDVVSYLPLSDMTTQLSDLWIPLCCGGATYFDEPNALKRSLLSTLRQVHPTRFHGFPRFWENIHRQWTMLEKMATPIHRKLIGWGRGIGHKIYKTDGSGCIPWGFTLAEHLIFHPVRVALGLDRCRFCYVGTEPISPDIKEYYRSLDLLLLDMYGTNESCGAHSLELPDTHGRGSCGLEIKGCKTKVKAPLTQSMGELCLWGRHIFMGYLGRKEETQAVLDGDGWLLSGDLGWKDDNGFLYIIEKGRGKYVGCTCKKTGGLERNH
ncbi:long-chain-fatty-acid--CoA ligase ACSBG2-like [Rhinophrynus dorsalis]